MTTHMTATREEWLEARRDLLAAEKDLTRRSDDVARLRQRLPSRSTKLTPSTPTRVARR